MKKALCKVSIIPLIICLIFSVYQSTAYAKSNDTSIKDVKISCGVLDPEFNSEKTKYTLYIPSDLTQIIITPTANSQDILSINAPPALIRNSPIEYDKPPAVNP